MKLVVALVLVGLVSASYFKSKQQCIGTISTMADCEAAASANGVGWGKTAGDEWVEGCIVNGNKAYWQGHTTTGGYVNGGYICSNNGKYELQKHNHCPASISDITECQAAAKAMNVPYQTTAGAEWKQGCIVNNNGVYWQGATSTGWPVDGGYLCATTNSPTNTPTNSPTDRCVDDSTFWQDFGGCTACPDDCSIGQYRFGCGHDGKGRCLACNTPKQNAHHVSNGDHGQAGSCAEVCDRGYHAVNDECVAITNSPTKYPTDAPTKNPTLSPTKNPTKNPTNAPTDSPTDSPTKYPTKNPTMSPTKACRVTCKTAMSGLLTVDHDATSGHTHHRCYIDADSGICYCECTGHPQGE